MKILEQLRILCGETGVAGEEGSAAEKAAGMLREYTDDVCIDEFHNVIGKVHDAGEGKPHLLLDAHIDEIGLMLTHITEEGFLRVTSCGGIDRRLLLAQKVWIHGKETIPGIIATTPPHLSTEEERGKVPKVDEIFVDTGYTKAELEKILLPGDRITFSSSFLELENGRVSTKAMDDRSCAVAILHGLELLKGKELPCSLTVLFSTQEEVGGSGAKIAAYRINPDIAIVTDVSFALTSDAEPHRCGKLGDGAMIGYAPILDKTIHQDLIALAKEKDIPHQLEIMGGSTGTNADSIVTSRNGVRTGLISLPQRYMHTPIEVIQLSDLEAVGALLAAYILKEGK